MEVLNETKAFKVIKYEKVDFTQDFENMNGQMLRILASHEKSDFDYEKAKQYIYDKNTDFFLNPNLDGKLYVLYSKLEDKPIAFALFSHDKVRYDWHLEYICTNKEYTNIGFAEALLKVCAKDLSKTDVEFMSSVINKNNDASLAMHNRFVKSLGLPIDVSDIGDNRYAYTISISELKNKDIKEDVKELIF